MQRRLLPALLAATGAVFVWSAIAPYDRATWWLEVFPALLALPILIATRRRFPFTTLAYCLIALHACILLVGGHYTYARVPLGFWLREALGLVRNNYDRLGHLAQGFVPAIVARELLLRTRAVRRGWSLFLVTCVCLSISVAYELLEWWTALVAGGAAEDFLATQGDPWDTQWDMFLALVGALAAQIVLGPWHDRQIARLEESRP